MRLHAADHRWKGPMHETDPGQRRAVANHEPSAQR
jgi:hypothetical protein